MGFTGWEARLKTALGKEQASVKALKRTYPAQVDQENFLPGLGLEWRLKANKNSPLRLCGHSLTLMCPFGV